MQEYTVLLLSVFLVLLPYTDEATSKQGNGNKRRPQNSMTSSPNKVWPSTTIPYSIEPDLRKTGRDSIKKGIILIETYTCMRFRRRISPTEHHIKFTQSDTSPAIIGYDRKAMSQKVRVCEQMQELTKRVVHGLFHALGRYHEHQRPDRDKYVQVMWSHISPRFRSRYTKYNDIVTQGLPYDYRSIMHSKSHIHSVDGKATLVSLDDHYNETCLGSAFLPTEYDYLHIRLLYCEATAIMVNNVSAIAGTNHIDVVWSTPRFYPVYFRIDVVCKLLSNGDTYRYKTYKANLEDTQLRVSDLHPRSSCVYTFFAVYNPAASNDRGITGTVFTLNTIPTVVPTGVRFSSRTKTSVIVDWDNKPCFESEAIDLFIIAIKSLSNIQLEDRYLYRPYNKLTETRIHIEYLRPGKTYELKIAAVNDEGTGPFSSPLTFTTKH